MMRDNIDLTDDPCHWPHDPLVAKHTNTEIVEYGFFRGHPAVVLEGEAFLRYADDLTPIVDTEGAYVERPCRHCGLLATPDGPDPCLGMLPGVRSACCGHGIEEPYVAFLQQRGQEALDFFAHHGVGPKTRPASVK
jgi:hypothetical protein